MRFLRRRSSPPPAPGLRVTVRVDRRIKPLLNRVRPGEAVLVSQQDLDRATADRLVAAGVTAVLNTLPMISGRYPNLGPQVLADAGVLMIDRLGDGAFDLVRDGSKVRLHDGAVYPATDDGAHATVMGRELDPGLAAQELAAARDGLTAHLEAFTHNSTEFLRREQDLLLHGIGLPELVTKIAGRPVLVVVSGHRYEAELQAVERFIREQRPVLIGVERGATALARAGHRPDVVILSASDLDTAPAKRVLTEAKDIVVLRARGAARHSMDPLERRGVNSVVVETGATTEDAALILADAHEPSVIVGVGMHATIDEFLDRRRAGLASTYLTRLKVGHRLVDAGAVPTLYSGQVRPRHLLALALAGLAALAAAISTTPVGQGWADLAASHAVDLYEQVQGMLP